MDRWSRVLLLKSKHINMFIEALVTKNKPKMEGVLMGLNNDSSPTDYKPLLDNISRNN